LIDAFYLRSLSMFYNETKFDLLKQLT